MDENSGYSLDVLRPGSEFTLYRGHSLFGPDFLAVVANGPRAIDNSEKRLRHENSLAAELDPRWAAKPIGLRRHDGECMLMLEDCGIPADVLRERSESCCDLKTGLALAIEIVRSVRAMHQHGFIHKDIRPANILVDAAGRVRLTGFGFSTRLRSEKQSPGPPDVIAGTFAYMAPEQTGRMNRSIDTRSDLYSLGVTLYELFTNTLPFEAVDPMQWIHCHVAQQPPAPSERASDLPGPIDAIILKLLAKNPEDRYQTAAGLELDLVTYLHALSQKSEILGFTLGHDDLSDHLLIPEKLYGREVEFEQLLIAAKRALLEGTTELVLVSGAAGIGKSSFVNELHRLLVPQHGLFAAGKFDQYKRDIPYATLAQAFRGLVRHLLGRSETELSAWSSELQKALGPNGQLMINLVPELALIIGEQPLVAPIEPHLAQSRFHLAFINMLGVFARADHPLLLFIDDLQWLDKATLALLQAIATSPDLGHLLLVGAYRDDEVRDDHALSDTIEAVRGGRASISEIALGSLNSDDLAAFCADALKCEIDRAVPLARMILEKTGGNPFFAIQFVIALYDDGLLSFQPIERNWTWDVARIRIKGITENVAQLMSEKLGRLAADTQNALGKLACLGVSADQDTIRLAVDSDDDRLANILLPAVEAGIILHQKETYAFTHDRMQEASYRMIASDELAHAHLAIARSLLAATDSETLGDRLFEIANHFDRGAPAIETQAERILVAGLCLLAGMKAKGSSAYASAQAHFARGRALLRLDSWFSEYRLTFDLELQSAECEIVGGNLAAAENRIEALIRHAEGASDEASAICLSVLLFFTTGRNERAVEAALGYLAKFGVDWSSRPSENEVRREYEEMHQRLGDRNLEELRDLPAMTDPQFLAIMSVLTELFPAAYAFDRYLLDLVLLRMTNISLEHGHCESSSVAYGALNMALGSHFGDYSTASKLGRLAVELVGQSDASRYKARVYSCFAAFTMPWIEHVAQCRPMMDQAFEIGTSMGDAAFAAYNSRNLLSHLLFSGQPLASVAKEIDRILEFAETIQLGMPADRFIGQRDFVRRLRGTLSAGTDEDDAWATQNVKGQPGLAMMVCYHWVFRLQERYLANDIPSALHAASQVEDIRWAMRSSIELADYDFYAALSSAAACDISSGTVRDGYIVNLERHYERLCSWAEHCPENFDNRKALIGAEMSRLAGKELQAQRLYEEALGSARLNGFMQNEGLVGELAGRFYAELGLVTAADAHIRNARNCFARWGVVGKIRQLDGEFPHLRAQHDPRPLATTIDAHVSSLDVEAVDKASQTLSSEMMLPNLLEKLMRLAVEHAGAERGSLILLKDGDPHIEARATTNSGSVAVSLDRARVTGADVPVTVLNYSLRTGERLILDDATASGADLDDPYVGENRPRSVLCLPIFKEKRVIGALYLENNLATHAFTADRVAVLDFLASQAAIWLENARLYSDLTRSEGWLREAQHLSLTGSFYWQVESEEVQFSEQMYRIYELDPSNVVTLPDIFSRIYEEDRHLAEEMIQIARGPGTDLDYIYRARMPDQTVKHMHLVAHGTKDVDGKVVYTGAIQDVTARYNSDEALGKARSELAHVTRITTLGVLTASIAHEVNQPLLGIVTNARTCLKMLSADPPNLEGARRTTERSIRDGHRAADVIKRLRALFGKKSVTLEAVDLSDATREVIALSASELQRNKVMLQADLAADLPFAVGDRVQLQQVILNLLLNASDAMTDVRDRPRKLSIKTARDGDERVRFEIRDDGIGLSNSQPERLFEAFYTTKSEGMGMGLSVSRSIIESHRGRLSAHQNDGPGATFSFWIPCTGDQSPAPLIFTSKQFGSPTKTRTDREA
jgi:predicted ATPase/signal transduction histidine kinase